MPRYQSPMHGSLGQKTGPEDIKPATPPNPEALHPGLGWMLCYASGGCTLPGFEDYDRYFSNEPALAGASYPDARLSPARNGNNYLNQEAVRHGRDLSVEELLDTLPKLESGKLAKVLQSFDELEIPLIFWTHRLNRFRAEGHTGPRSSDPFGIVVGFPDIPALDRALGGISERRSIRKWENFVTFLQDADGALRRVESAAVEQGFYLTLRAGSHSSSTIKRNNQNAPVSIPDDDDDKTAKKVVTLGSLFS